MELRYVVSVSILALASGLGAPAYAGDAKADQPPAAAKVATSAPQVDSGTRAIIQEVIVTANRRSESVQRSSLAIEVVSGKDLSEKGVTQANDLQSVVPGLTISLGGPAVQTYLRGVGTKATDANAESAIAYNINGVYISRPNGLGPIFFDLERVEVLKGPQGTLYGRNASGGAINLISRRPTQDFNGEVSVDAGNYGLARVAMAVGGGVSDTLSLRGAMQYTKHHGYLSDGYDDQKSLAARLSALWKPTSAVSLLVVGEYSREEGQGPGVVARSQQVPEPSDHWQGASIGLSQQPPTAFIPGGTTLKNDGSVKVDVRAISAQLDVDLGPATLTFIPAYRDTKPYSLTYTPGFRFETTETSKQQSYELRLGNQAGGLKWTVGGYFFNEAQTQFFDLKAIPIQNGTVDSPLHTRSYAAFADAIYSIAPSLRVLGGVRYSKDRKSQDGQSIALLPAPSVTSNYGHLSEHKVTWRVGAEFDVAPQNMLFATVSTGYKAGGFFPSVAYPNNSFKPEKLTAYTIGSRNRFLDNHVQLNIEGFYWKYGDKQERFLGATPSGGTGLLTTNAGQATLYGFSTDLVVKPTADDTFHVGVEYLHSRYDSFVYNVYNPPVPPGINSYPITATTCKLGPAVPYTANDFIPPLQSDSQQIVDCSGKPLVRAPKWVGSVSYAHVFELADGATLTPHAEGQFSSSYYLTPDFIGSSQQGGYVALNADLTLRLKNGVSFTAWGRNLGNTAIYTGGFRYPFSRSTAAGGDPTLFYANIRPPRTFGGTIKYSF